MSKLIIIGNGFDIAHGLPTDFKFFIKYIKENHPDFYENISKYIPEEDLWNSFEKALSYLDDEQLQDDNMCYLRSYGDDNWRDSFHHDFQYMIGEELKFASDIPRYIYKWLKKILINSRPIIDNRIINNEATFLNFNYTNTLEKVYGIHPSRILYIHGNLENKEELIVGHHNSDLFAEEPIPEFDTEEEWELYYDNIYDDVRVEEAKQIIKDYYRNTYKNVENIITANTNFFQSLFLINEVYILGHSMSDVDFDYFTEINNHISKNCKWYISYYSQEDLTNALTLINQLNITKYQLIKLSEICI